MAPSSMLAYGASSTALLLGHTVIGESIHV